VVFCFILLLGLVKLKIHLEMNGSSTHVHVWLLAVPFINSYSAHVHVWLLAVPFINSYYAHVHVWLLAVPFINSYYAHVHVWLLAVPFINCYYINLSVAEIVLKVALNTIIFIYVTVTCCLRIIFGLQGHRPLVIAI
jgi:hypothetical protein